MEVQQTLLNTLWREDTGLLGRVCVCVYVCVCRRKWQSTPIFLPGKSHGQRSLAGYIVHGVTRVRDDLELNHHLFQLEASKQNINFSRS